jgi:hypothetical protein
MALERLCSTKILYDLEWRDEWRPPESIFIYVFIVYRSFEDKGPPPTPQPGGE